MASYNLSICAIYIIIVAFTLFLNYKRGNDQTGRINLDSVSFNKVFTLLLPALVVIVGAAIRVYSLDLIPMGLHQDEASIGYESYILSEYGMDRDGNVYPVYPITYGSGGGSPLMIYLNVLTTGLFGFGVKTLRMLPAILGIFTLVSFFYMVKTLSAEGIKRAESVSSLQNLNGEYLWIPLVSLAVLAFCPWHVMLSRWSLDSNTTPFWICLAMMLFSLGAYYQRESTSFGSIGTLFSNSDRRKRRTLWSSDVKATVLFTLSAIVYSLCLYSYGSTTIIIPIHLIIIAVFCIKTKRMTIFQLILGIIFFILVSVPLMLFYAVNFLGLPEIYTPLFTVTAFTAKRSVFAGEGGFATGVIHSFITIIKNITFGNSSEQIVNYIPGYPPLFAFTFPVTLVGIIISAVRTKRGEILDVFFTSLFIPALLFGLAVEEDINRMVVLFIPIVYYLARGFVFVTNEFIVIEKTMGDKAKRYLAIFCKAVAPAIYLIAAAAFLNTYFTDYNKMNAEAFMPGYGEACAYADSLDGEHIYSTYSHVSAPYMVALYYTKTSPEYFISTVHYKDDKAEFRIADSFGRFIFGIPSDVSDDPKAALDGGDILILHKTELADMGLDGDNDYQMKKYGNFAVVYR